jgi:hypothetical protein
MTKWLVLAAGAFLFFNGTMSRTYGYTNPAKYCWNMDYIRLHRCFASPAGPQIVVWGTILLGAALIAGCVLLGRRRAG